jgi:putative transposase
VATHQKKAVAQRAHVIFADESGLLMAPLVRRTWSLRGQRPILHQRGKHREKVSIAGALWWAPWRRQQLGLIFHTLVDAYFNNQRSAAFLETLMRDVANRIIVVWDGGNMHKGDPIRAAVARFQPRLTLEKLPPYAPMLNPVEPLWSWLKYGRLCNAAPSNASELNRSVVRELRQISADQDFLRSMWHGSELPLPRALLM